MWNFIQNLWALSWVYKCWKWFINILLLMQTTSTWKGFERNLIWKTGEYYDLYIQSDIFLLSDVFIDFQNMSWNI